MYKIKVSNLPRWISDLNLKQFFHNCGKIAEVNLALDKNTLCPLGHAYIVFGDLETAERALEKNGSLLDGVNIKVEFAEELEMVEETVA